MKTTLFKLNPSPPARAVMMVIDILGADVEQKDLNPLFREQDAPEYQKLNPMKTIPFIDEGDYWLGDSHAIMIYLVDKYGKPEHSHLYPSDIRKRATVNQRLFFDCGVLFPRLRAVMAPTYAGRIGEMSKYMIRNIEEAFSMMEAYLSENVYLADDVVTLADLSAISTIASIYGLHPVDEKKYPKLTTWIKNMNEKDYVKRINIQGAEDHANGLKAFMEHNKQNLQSKL